MENRLLNLLEKNGISLNLKSVRIKNVGVLPSDEIYKIYKRRSAISPKVSEELVKSLESFKGGKIRLTNIVVNGDVRYLIFTDEEISTLTGIIKLSEGP